MIRRADRLAGIDVDYEPLPASPRRSVRLLQERAEELRASTHQGDREADQSGTQLIQGPRIPTRSGAIRRFADPAYRGVRSARR
jgi:hypothetical protein